MNSQTTTDQTTDLRTPTVDLKLEAVVIPVSDVDRSKSFYEGLGWRLDADFGFDNGFRVVQFTPPGSPSRSSSAPTSPLPSRAPPRASTWSSPTSRPPATRSPPAGVQISEVFHPESPGAQFQPDGTTGRVDGPARTTAPATARSPPSPTLTATAICFRRSPPGCPAVSTPRETTYASVNDLTNALIRAATAHGEHEKLTGEYDKEWPAWYAAYMVAEQPAKNCRSRHPAHRTQHHRTPKSKEGETIMTTMNFDSTTTATPEQFVAGLTDFGPGRSQLFPNSADEFLEVHDRGDDLCRRHRGLRRHLGTAALRLVGSRTCRPHHHRLQHLGWSLRPYLHLHADADGTTGPPRRGRPRRQEPQGSGARTRTRDVRKARPGKGDARDGQGHRGTQLHNADVRRRLGTARGAATSAHALDGRISTSAGSASSASEDCSRLEPRA